MTTSSTYRRPCACLDCCRRDSRPVWVGAGAPGPDPRLATVVVLFLLAAAVVCAVLAVGQVAS